MRRFEAGFLAVMAGLDPAIHDLLASGKDVDARVKPGHDEEGSKDKIRSLDERSDIRDG